VCAFLTSPTAFENTGVALTQVKPGQKGLPAERRAINRASGSKVLAGRNRASTSCDDVLNDLLLPMQIDFHVMFFGLYDFSSQLSEIYVKRMANDLFFFFSKIHGHIIHLLAVFNSSTRMADSNRPQRMLPETGY
jgi:hypothetical protein